MVTFLTCTLCTFTYALCMPHTPLCVPYTHFTHTSYALIHLYGPLHTPYTYLTYCYACPFMCLTHALCALMCALCRVFTTLTHDLHAPYVDWLRVPITLMLTLRMPDAHFTCTLYVPYRFLIVRLLDSPHHIQTDSCI